MLQHDNKSVGEALLKSIKIVGATCIGSSTRRIFSELEYDVAIVDEAGQISLHNLLVPLVKVKKFILVGDHIQLPPMDEKELRSYLETAVVPQVTDESDSEKNPFAPFRSVGEIYSKSLFEVLYSKSGEKYLSNHTVMLSEQYRCHPDIAAFVSGHFYANEYISGISPESRKLEIAGFCKPLCFVDTVRLPDRGEATKAGSTSPHNKAEARLCAEKVCDILMEIRRDPEKYSGLIDKAGNYDIGVISGYGDQVELLDSTLQTQLAQRLGGTPEAKDEAKRMVSRISIDTLDSFQGMEKEIIVFSCVRSNAECKVGFMNDTRRINVLMTRARSLLIMVGDSGTLCNTYATAKHNHAPVKDIFEDYIKTCRETGHYIAPGEEVGKV